MLGSLEHAAMCAIAILLLLQQTLLRALPPNCYWMLFLPKVLKPLVHCGGCVMSRTCCCWAKRAAPPDRAATVAHLLDCFCPYSCRACLPAVAAFNVDVPSSALCAGLCSAAVAFALRIHVTHWLECCAYGQAKQPVGLHLCTAFQPV